MNQLVFQIPSAIAWGGVLVAAALAWFAWVLHRRGLAPRRMATLLALRAVFFNAIILLVARPV